MAGSMRFLQTFQTIHKFIGISPKRSFIDRRNIIFGISNAQFALTSLAFFVLEANSMFDYGFAFFVLIFIINPVVIYFLFVWQSSNTFKFIENCEEFIEKSTYEKKYCTGVCL